MASNAKQFFLLFLLTLISSQQIHARESQFFNKIPSNNGEKETEVVVPNNEETVKNNEPNFIPENENGGYGLYGHQTGQFPPTTTKSTTTPTNLPYNGEPTESYPKYLPKNYNTKAYVTEPEGYRGEFENNKNTNYLPKNYNTEAYVTEAEGYRGEFDNNKNSNFYNGDNSYYNSEQQAGLGETKLTGKSYSTNPSNNGNFYNNNYGNSNSYHNGEQQGMSDTRFYNNNNNNYYNHNVGNLGGVQKQGMSDTRFLENGKYFYDINMEQNNNRGPDGSTNNKGFFGNPENSYEFNNYQNNQEQFQNEQFQNFQDEEDLP